MADVTAKLMIIAAFCFLLAVVAACGSRQPPGGNMWVGVQHMERGR